MKLVRFLSFWFGISALLFGLWRPVASQPAGANAPAAPVAHLGAVVVDHVQAQLVAATEHWDPSQPLKLGVLLKHAPQWHTYWRNAGDSGLATQLTWTLPAGVQAGAIEWPLPQRIGLANLANYGYEGELLLPVTLTPQNGFNTAASTAASTKPARFEVLAQWLVCREVCIPGEALLALELPVISGQASKPSAQATSFSLAQSRGPNGQTLQATLHTDPNKKRAILVLPKTLPATINAASLSNRADLEFFPYVESWVQPAAAQTVLNTDAGIAIDLLLGDNPPEIKAGPVGVLRYGSSIVEVLATPGAAAPTNIEKIGEVAVTHFIDASAKGKLTQTTPSVAPPTLVAAAASQTNSLSLGLALGLAFLGGVLLNLMPCVLPVLSLKLFSLLQNPTQARRDAVWFGFGVVASFIALALALFAFRSAGQAIGWGFQLQSPVFVMLLAVLFTMLALNMAGLFEMGTRVSQLANLGGLPAANRSGPGAAFMAGVLAVVAASPCSAPFMGSALGYALAAPLWELLLVFAALGIGMALPFVLIAWVPALQRFMPKPGRWMVSFKQFLAFPLLATVAWLLWVFGLQTDMNQLFVLTLALVCVAALCWLWGKLQLEPSRSLSKLVAAGCLVALTAVLLVRATDQEASEPVVSSDKSSITGWQVFSPAALQSALTQGKPVFIDFTAAWCVSCQVNKQAVLNTAATQALFAKKGVVLLRADWTKRDTVITEALKGYGRHAVPVYVVYKAGQSQANLLPELLTYALLENAF